MSKNAKILEYKTLLKDKYHLSEDDACKACETCENFYDEAYYEDDTSGETFDDLNEELEKTGFSNSIKMTEDFLSCVKKTHLK